VVFDTNVVVRALLFAGSTSGRAFRLVLETGEVLVSVATLEELAQVLSRPRFERYVTAAEREEFIEALVERALLVEPSEVVRKCRDPKDDMFLELALAGKADFIVTGDEDLLVLHPFGQTEIVTVEHFLDAVK